MADQVSWNRTLFRRELSRLEPHHKTQPTVHSVCINFDRLLRSFSQIEFPDRPCRSKSEPFLAQDESFFIAKGKIKKEREMMKSRNLNLIYSEAAQNGSQTKKNSRRGAEDELERVRKKEAKQVARSTANDRIGDR